MLPGVQTGSGVLGHFPSYCAVKYLDTQQPLPVLSCDTAHYSASDDCWWSILWLGVERKKSLTVCCLLGWKPVGQCDTKHSWVLWKVTVEADREWSLKHKLPFMSTGGRGVSNGPIGEQLSVTIQRRNVMWGGDRRKHVSVSVVSMRIYGEYNITAHVRESQPDSCSHPTPWCTI